MASKEEGKRFPQVYACKGPRGTDSQAGLQPLGAQFFVRGSEVTRRLCYHNNVHICSAGVAYLTLSRARHFNHNMALKRALLILAEGAEEMEAVIVVDVLRRAGVHVDVAGLTGKQVTKCSRSVFVQPDTSLSDAKNEATYDAVVLPGGLQGAKNLSESEDVKALLNEQYNAGRIVAAICAAPTVLRAAGVGLGKTITSYPSVKDQLEGYTYSEDRVVVDGNLITSRAPGTAFEFALKLVEHLCGADKVEALSSSMLLK